MFSMSLEGAFYLAIIVVVIGAAIRAAFTDRRSKKECTLALQKFQQEMEASIDSTGKEPQ